MRHRDIVYERSGLAIARGGGKHSEFSLMDVEVMVFRGDVHEFPSLLHGLIARRKRQTHVDVCMIEGGEFLESSRHGVPARVHFLIAKTKTILSSRGHTKKDPPIVSWSKSFARWRRSRPRRCQARNVRAE